MIGIASFSDRAPDLVASVARRLHLPGDIGEPAFHVFGWLAFTLLVTLALRGAWARRSAAVGIVLLGVAIEILQPMLSSNRSFQPGDVAANVIGVVVGLALGLLIAGAADRRQSSEVSEGVDAVKSFLVGNGRLVVVGLGVLAAALVGFPYVMGLESVLTAALFLAVITATAGAYRILSKAPVGWSQPLEWSRLATAALAGLIVVGLAIQVIPYGRDHANPPITGEPVWDSPRTRELAVRACFDCHSNEVKYPWYSQIAPASWAVQSHIDSGRSKVNYSEWDQPQKEADESAETVIDGEMPPAYFTRFTHAEARLSDLERHQLIDGLVATFGDDDDHGDGDDDDDD